MATVKKSMAKTKPVAPARKGIAPKMMQAPPTASAPMGGGMMKKGGKMKKAEFGDVMKKIGTGLAGGGIGSLIGGMKKGGKLKKAEKGGSFPDLNKDGKITKADILKGRGVIAKSGTKMKKK